MGAAYGDREPQGDCQPAAQAWAGHWRAWDAGGAILRCWGGQRAEADEYAEEEAIDNAQMDEDMDTNMDKSKNNGKDKDSKSNEEISL